MLLNSVTAASFVLNHSSFNFLFNCLILSLLSPEYQAFFVSFAGMDFSPYFETNSS